MSKCALFLAAALTTLAPALAQQATIQGVITDPTGAVVPGAKVTVTNRGTSVAANAETNDQGFYSVPGLVPGAYRVEVNAQGFAQASANLTLNVDQTARLDVALKVGTVGEAIEVSASTAMIDSETSTVGQVIDNKRIVELPLNGRNYLDLAQLTTGVAPSSGSRTNNKGSFSALGMRSYQTNVLLDGIDNNSRASGGQLGFEAQAVTPSIDSVQEFKVVTNNNSAEYGFRMGGTVVVQTKSGTNEFHGTAYEFLRNEKFDAVNFFAVGQPRPAYKQNQFGANMGGRIIRDRTFFFASYEGTRIRTGESSISTVPTTAYRNGIFSTARPLFDPATTTQTGPNTWSRAPFPGNQIPTSRIDPVAAKVIALYPEPNLPGIANNHFFSGAKSDDTNQVDARLDHSFSSAHRIFGRYSRRMYDGVDPGPLPLPADGGLWTTTSLTSDSVVGNLNSTLSPTLNNELRVGFTHTPSILDIPWTETLNSALGIKGLSDLGDDNARGMSRFTPQGYAEVGARSFWPNRNNLNFLQISDHVMKVQGRHVLKTGFEFRREQIFRRAARFARGQAVFNGAFTQNPAGRAGTGDSFADMFLGLASGGNIGNQNGEDARTLNYSVYFQDDWKISRRLTLNLGVRWDRFGIPSFHNSAVSRFEFTPGSQDYRIVRPTSESDNGGSPDNNNFAPRVGLAWQVNDKTVFRSGFGLYYGQPDAISHDGDARFANLPPDFTEIQLQTDQLVRPAMVVQDGFPPGLIPTTTIQENVAVKTAVPYMPNQYAMQWFADIQRELPFQTVLTVSYLAAEARHLVWTRNINVPLSPGSAAVKQRRPHPFFGAINYRDAGGKSSYHGLAIKGEKRYSNGLTFLGSYTWSHAIDDGAGTLDDGAVAGTAAGGIRDPYNMRLNRGNSDYDVRHLVTISGVYDLPFGKGRTYMNAGGPLDWFFGGWQLGAIFKHRSGLSFSPSISQDLTNTGTTNYPNRIGEGNLPEDQRTLARWFDVSAFQAAPPSMYGNAGRNILYGPSATSADLKIGKNFYFTERYRLEFRTEMFNFTNTPNFGRPDTRVNLPQAGQITTADPPRRIQFGLKFIY